MNDSTTNNKQVFGRIEASDNWRDLEYEIKEEGCTTFRIALAETIYDAPAFFNPVMVVNRDLSILFTYLYSRYRDRPIRIIDPLAGIGIRALRLAIEEPNAIETITINDFNEISTDIATFNIQQLGLDDKIIQYRREARSLLYNLAEKQLKYHYLDLDPFGPPSPFIDSIWAVFSISGMISITATDMTALCGVYPKACLRKYGSIPINNFHTHETAARILISLVVRSAARNGYGVKPIFTSSVDHYTKIFFLLKKGRGEANNSMEMLGFSYTCNECFQIRYIAGKQENIECCGIIDVAGPLWVSNIFEEHWCENGYEYLLNLENNEKNDITQKKYPTRRRLIKLLDEGRRSTGLHGYYVMDKICKKIGISQPRFKIFKLEMETRGYRVVQSRFTKQAFRTDAPSKVIFSVVKEIMGID